MPYPLLSARCQLVGASTGGEIFETGFGLASPVPGDESDANAIAASIATSFTTNLLANIVPLISPDFSYTGVRVYFYVNGGDTATLIGTAPIAGAVGTSTQPGPLQCCMVATLNTGAAGRRARGRMYLPANGVGFTAAHQFPTTRTQPLVNSLAAFFEDINADGISGQASVISLAGTAARPITSISIDQRPDVQRRRANKQSGGTVETATVSV